MINGKDLLRDYSEMLADRLVWDQTWMDIASLLVPHEREIASKSVQGSRQTCEIYDSTGIDALDKLQSAIIGTMFSAVVPWFTLVPRQEDLKTDPEVLDWTETVSRDIFDEINGSNFDRVAPGMVNSVAAYGTGAMGVVEIDPAQSPGTRGFRGLHHIALPIGTYVIAENGWGDVDTLIRTFWMRAGALLRRWPNAPYSTEQHKRLMDKPLEQVQIIHGVTPGMQGNKRIWDSLYVLAGWDSFGLPSLVTSNIDGVVELEEATFREFIYQVPRWYQSPGEAWGRGRGHIAFPELRTANRARQLKLRAWAKTIDPPIMVLNRGIVGKARFIPGASISVRDMSSIAALDFKIRFDHEAIPEQESKLQIRQMFFTEQLLQFAIDRKTPPTATEVLQRMDFLHQLLGPATGRIRVEMQTPYIKRVFGMKLRAGDFPDPPRQLLQTGGVLDIEYLGPLARAQHNDELRGMMDTLQIVGGSLAVIDPNVTDNYDVDRMARDLPRITGTSRQYLRKEEAVQMRREERAAQQEAAQAQKQAVTVGQVAKDLGAAGASDAQAAQAGA